MVALVKVPVWYTVMVQAGMTPWSLLAEGNPCVNADIPPVTQNPLMAPLACALATPVQQQIANARRGIRRMRPLYLRALNYPLTTATLTCYFTGQHARSTPLPLR